MDASQHAEELRSLPSTACDKIPVTEGPHRPVETQRMQRATQVYLVAFSRFMCYITRSQLGVLLPFLAELNLSTADKGSLLSRYASGYLITQIPGGLLSDRFGAYPVMATAILLSAIGCAAAPTFAELGPIAFGNVFFVLGLAQGVIMPGACVSTMLVHILCVPQLPTVSSLPNVLSMPGLSSVPSCLACLPCLVCACLALACGARLPWLACARAPCLRVRRKHPLVVHLGTCLCANASVLARGMHILTQLGMC